MEKGKTIAVLGNGFNNIFPKENIGLYNTILENDGLIISEYPPGVKHKSAFFLERNRIISGLSLGILVVEASYRSGTSVTAKLAKKQNRKVFALPHEIYDSHGVGTNKLIREGAILVTCIDNILSEFSVFQHLINPNSKALDEFNNISISNNTNNNNLNSILNSNYKLNSFLDTKIQNEKFKKKKLKNNKYFDVYNFIYDSPISINAISHKTSKSINEISNTLFMLELEGYIKKVAGGYICIFDN